LFAIGGALRIAPAFVPGRSFSGLVAIQKNHALVADHLYRVIRNPSYLGLMIDARAARRCHAPIARTARLPTQVVHTGSRATRSRSALAAAYCAGLTCAFITSRGRSVEILLIRVNIFSHWLYD